MDLVQLMKIYRKNTSMIPFYVWYRDGEELASDGAGELGNIEKAFLPMFIENERIEDNFEEEWDPAPELPEGHEKYAIMCPELYMENRQHSLKQPQEIGKEKKDLGGYSLIFVKVHEHDFSAKKIGYNKVTCPRQFHRKAVRDRAKEIAEKFR